jgi:hypothetical protein
MIDFAKEETNRRLITRFALQQVWANLFGSFSDSCLCAN